MPRNPRNRGRPLGIFNAALINVNPARLAALKQAAERLNSDVITPKKIAAQSTRKIRREILQHYQPDGASVANSTRSEVRAKRLLVVAAILNDKCRNLGRLSNFRAAEILAGELGRSPQTLRKDIAEIRKLTGPTS